MASIIWVKSFPARPTNGNPLGVFVRARPFADKNELRGRAAVAENNFVARGVQLAPRALAEVSANDRKRVAGDPIGGCEESGAAGATGSEGNLAADPGAADFGAAFAK